MKAVELERNISVQDIIRRYHHLAFVNSRPQGVRGRKLSRMTSKLLACTVGWQVAPFTDIGNLGGEKAMWVGGMKV